MAYVSFKTVQILSLISTNQRMIDRVTNMTEIELLFKLLKPLLIITLLIWRLYLKTGVFKDTY